MRLLLMAIALLAAPRASQAEDLSAIVFPVPAVAVRAGDTLTDEMVTARRLVASAAALRTHYTSRQSVVGKVAGRPLPAGAAIPLNALREAHAFKDGERVVVVYASGGLSIRATGIALQPGIIGGTARVRNVDTGVVVSGVVRQDGSVAVGD